MTTDPSFRYAGGTLMCLAKWPVCLLAEITAQDPRLDQLAELLDGETPIEEIVDFLSRDRVTRTPSFGVMLVGDESVRVVVHRSVHAVVDGHIVEAPQFFGETTVPREQKVSLQGGTGEALLPIAVGVALASVVEWAGTGSPAREKESPEKAEPEKVELPEKAEPPFAVAAKPEQPPAVPHSEVVPQVVIPEFVHSGADTPSVAEPVTPTVVTSEPSTVGPTAFDHLFGLDAVPDDEDVGRTQIAQATASLAELVEDFKQTVGLSDIKQSQQISGFIDAFNWGPPSQHQSVSTATASAPSAILPLAGSPAPSVEPVPVVLPPTPQAPAQAAGGPASARMAHEPGKMTRESPRTAGESFDATVRKSSLNALSDAGDVMVVAFRCDNGHFSPPYATQCRVCGIPLDQTQQPLEVVRPPLGVLKLWAGGTVLLDRGVIFGRNPHTVLGTAGPQPNLLKIEDPNRDVSSQHCWVRLEDWYVTVTDLNSTNGTQVVLPNRAPLTLRANDPLAIEPGTRVILANAFDFVYEVA